MPRLIFKVTDVAKIEGRGVLVIGDWQFGSAQLDEVIARKGDVIELRMPNGEVVASRIEAIAYLKRDIHLPPEVIASDIERGAEIYNLDAR